MKELIENKIIEEWKTEAKKNNKTLVLIICGDEGSGKDSRAKIIKNKFNLKRIVTSTNRPRCYGEVDGVDYHFLTNQEFDRAKNLMIAKAEHGYEKYGIEITEFTDKIKQKQDCYLILDLNGLKEVKRTLQKKYPNDFLVLSIYYQINEETYIEREKKKTSNMLKSYYEKGVNWNKQAHQELKDTKLVDIIVDTNEVIEEFQPKKKLFPKSR